MPHKLVPCTFCGRGTKSPRKIHTICQARKVETMPGDNRPYVLTPKGVTAADQTVRKNAGTLHKNVIGVLRKIGGSSSGQLTFAEIKRGQRISKEGLEKAINASMRDGFIRGV